ncbi:MAG: CPBP family intramembrane glutamic endopeptidase [Pseudobdellovibrionaceae bacterium]
MLIVIMEFIAYVVLPVYLYLLFIRTKQDVAEYANFKKIKSTKSRQQKYRKWVLESFLLFGLGSVLLLAAIGHFSNITHPLSQFTDLVPRSTTIQADDTGSRIPFILGMLTSGLLTGLVIANFAKKNKKKAAVIGDIQAMFPRNNAERFWAAILAINAGFSEEMFFRLLLPILFFIVFKNPVIALVLPILIFGLVHWYQGKIGVVFTAILGAGLTFLYLTTRNIFAVMAIHALIDLNGLILQPAIRGLHKK